MGSGEEEKEEEEEGRSSDSEEEGKVYEDYDPWDPLRKKLGEDLKEPNTRSNGCLIWVNTIPGALLGIELHELSFIPPFWVGFSKQRKKPGGRRSSLWSQNAFLRLSPSERSE